MSLLNLVYDFVINFIIPRVNVTYTSSTFGGKNHLLSFKSVFSGFKWGWTFKICWLVMFLWELFILPTDLHINKLLTYHVCNIYFLFAPAMSGFFCLFPFNKIYSCWNLFISLVTQTLFLYNHQFNAHPFFSVFPHVTLCFAFRFFLMYNNRLFFNPHQDTVWLTNFWEPDFKQFYSQQWNLDNS